MGWQVGWKVGAAVSFAVMVVGATLGVARVAWLEDQEVRSITRATLEERAAAPESTGQSVRLGSVRLGPEQVVVFELCAADPMEPERWADAMALAVWRPRAQEVMARSELTPDVLAHVRRTEEEGCLVFGRGRIQREDDYAVEALWETQPEHLATIPLVLRVQARRPLERVDGFLVVGTLLGSLLFVVFLGLRPRPQVVKRQGVAEPGPRAGSRAGAGPRVGPELGELDPWEEAQVEASGPPWAPELRVAIGLVLVVGSFLASGYLPPGAALGLAVGVALAGFEAATGVALATGPAMRRRLSSLGLLRPERWYVHLPIALLAGFALERLAVLATMVVPSTGRSAIQTFVSWPSGMLSFATLAVIAPLAEEVFFRGFVYGALRQRSRALAFCGAWLLFVAAHAPQTWGQWGALAAVGVTGLGLTTLRAVSGSTLVAAVAHLVYNGLLAVSAVYR